MQLSNSGMALAFESLSKEAKEEERSKRAGWLGRPPAFGPKPPPSPASTPAPVSPSGACPASPLSCSSLPPSPPYSRTRKPKPCLNLKIAKNFPCFKNMLNDNKIFFACPLCSIPYQTPENRVDPFISIHCSISFTPKLPH